MNEYDRYINNNIINTVKLFSINETYNILLIHIKMYY